MNINATKVLGVSASLRNSRFNNSDNQLCNEIKQIASQEELNVYLAKQESMLLAEFEKAGFGSTVDYDEIYTMLLKSKGNSGLSNTEVALAAALWGAHQEGSDISHVGLSEYFPARGDSKNLDQLRDIILDSDAILLSGPVYFGDRGSLAQEFIEFLKRDEACLQHVRNKLYGGISVGAKRNGGQETTLIYQLIDMCNINMLSVGNSSDTTSQYGGTVVAGDIGTAASDKYGLNTSIGTGKRLAMVSQMMAAGKAKLVEDNVNIAIWLLQDNKDSRGLHLFEKLCSEIEAKSERVKFHIKDFTSREVRRCIACDICPTHAGPSEEYRCIVKSRSDTFASSHEELINQDAILLAAYSPVDTKALKSVYQRFIERTRYLRRDDYVLGNVLSAPLVISEVNANQNLHIRMLTSMIRHHTVLHHPLLGVEYQKEIINWDFLVQQGLSFVENTKQLISGKLQMNAQKVSDTVYNPLGYVYSAKEAQNHIRKDKQKEALQQRAEKLERAKDRLEV